MNNQKPLAGLAVTALSLVLAHAALASPRGSEFDATLAPAAGGMGGVSVARPQDAVAMVFVNPATLSQLKSDYAFLVGAEYVSPKLETSGRPTDLFGGEPNMAPLTGEFEGTSRLTEAVAPHAVFISRLNDQAVIGAGLTAVSGLGGDFRHIAGLPNLISDLKIFGFNTSLGYEVNEAWSVGLTGTMAIASFQAGLSDSSASVNEIGFGFSLGTTYDTGPVMLGFSYKSKLDLTFNNSIEEAPNQFTDLKHSQPQELQFGVASTDSLFPNLLIAAELRWKNWSDVKPYSSFWDDQTTLALGVQQTLDTDLGALALRAGYSWSDGLRKDADKLGNSFGDLTQVAAPDDSGSLPVTPTFLQLVQASIANGFWKQSVSIGAGLQLSDTIRVDGNVGYAFDGKETFDRFESEGSVWHSGLGLTWTF